MAVSLLQPSLALDPNGVNVSEGGVCLRLAEALEVRSLVRLRLTAAMRARSRAGHSPQSLRCTGRVAWVTQRLDLRDAPPFLYDIGIEFVDPSPLLRRLLAQFGAGLSALGAAAAQPAAAVLRSGAVDGTLESTLIRGRRLLASLRREVRPSPRWHLTVSIDGVPCFSHRYGTERQAKDAWAKVKRQQAKP